MCCISTWVKTDPQLTSTLSISTSSLISTSLGIMWQRREDYASVSAFVKLIPMTFTNRVIQTFNCEPQMARYITQNIICEQCFHESSDSWKNYLVYVYNKVFEAVWRETRGLTNNSDRLTPRRGRNNAM